MSVYRTLTVAAQLSNNQVNASANVSDNTINANAQMINRINVNNVSDYNLLTNKPQINSVTLQGDKSFSDLGLESISNIELENILSI
jgi:hypothetical protein